MREMRSYEIISEGAFRLLQAKQFGEICQIIAETVHQICHTRITIVPVFEEINGHITLRGVAGDQELLHQFKLMLKQPLRGYQYRSQWGYDDNIPPMKLVKIDKTFQELIWGKVPEYLIKPGGDLIGDVSIYALEFPGDQLRNMCRVIIVLPDKSEFKYLREIEFFLTGARGAIKRITDLQELTIFKQFATHTTQGLFLAKMNGMVIYANRGIRKLLAIDQEDIGRWQFYYTERSRQVFDFEILPALLQEKHWEGELEIINHQGKQISTFERYFLICDDQYPKLIANVISDITLKKQEEQVMLEHQNNLESLIVERTRDVERIHQKLLKNERLAIIGTFSSGVGHELRNPLGVIQGSLYYLNRKRDQFSEKSLKHLGIIERELNRANGIITELLEYSREQKILPQWVNLGILIQGIIKGIMIPHQIEIRHISTVEDPVFIDPQKIGIVLDNLIQNGIQAIKGKGGITIRTTSQLQTIEISVEDSGSGIRPQDIKHVFEPLFTTRRRGIGLGLAIVKSIVEVHQGEISVQSTPGSGTTFIVSLPGDLYKQEDR